MASTTLFRDTNKAARLPMHGTLPSAANQLFPKGAMVQRDTAGRAVNPATADTSGLPVHGVSAATYDNRTGSEAGGGAGDLDVELEYGVFGFDISGTAPIPGDVVYCVDNQTVSLDDLSGQRGIAGLVSEVRAVNGTNQAFVLLSPDGAALAADKQGFLPVTVGMAPAWVDGVSNGFDPVTFAWSFNPTIDDEPFVASVALPDDLDTSKDVFVEIRAAISSVATDDDVTMLCAARINGGADIAPTNAAILAVPCGQQIVVLKHSRRQQPRYS